MISTRRLGTTLLIGTTLLACAPPEERIAEATAPIIDGRAATAAELYGTVALATVADGEPFCTGTLVAPTVVVTAAHCLFDEQGSLGAADIEVVAGVLDAYDVGPENLYAVASATGHSGYADDSDPGPLGQDDDLAVITLTSAVEGQSAVPVLAASDTDTYVQQGTNLTITGYGQRDVEASNPDLFGVLYIAETPYQERTEHEYLAGGPGNPDSCTGDSGGPSYVDIEGTLYLLGATSRASEAGTPPCGSGGLYTFVSAYESFVVDSSGGAFAGATSVSGGEGEGEGEGEGASEDDGGCSIGASRDELSPWWIAAALALATRRRRRV